MTASDTELIPLAERHHMLVIKSYVEPQLKMKINLETTLNWLPLDTPTAQELAQTNLIKAQTGAALIASGALSSEDERQRIATDKTSGYNEIGLIEDEMPEEESPEEDLVEKDMLKTEDANPPQQEPEDGEHDSPKFETAQDSHNAKSKK